MATETATRRRSGAPKPNLTQAETNHLRRLLGWVRTEVGQTPNEIVATMRGLNLPEPSPEAKARLIEYHQRAAAVPKYVRAAVKALEKLLVKQHGTIVDVETEVAPKREGIAGPVFGFDAAIEVGGTRHGSLPAPPLALADSAPWLDQAPTECGFYRLTCDENEGEVDVVLVEKDQYGILAAFDTDVGTLGVSDFHDGLTNPRWQRMEGEA